MPDERVAEMQALFDARHLDVEVFPIAVAHDLEMQRMVEGEVYFTRRPNPRLG